MKRWIKLEVDLMNDSRIKKIIDSNLGFAGLGIYIALRLKLEITNGLTPECFYNEVRGELFDVLKSRYLRRLPLTDMVMVAKEYGAL